MIPPGHMCVLLVLLVAFVTGFFLREVSVFHRLSSHVDINNVTMCEVVIHNLYFLFLLLFTYTLKGYRVVKYIVL